jgi:predicted nucleic acid-binding protein
VTLFSSVAAQLVVVDASVAVKWLLRDEAHLAEADHLLDLSDTGNIMLLAPQQLDVEVGSSLRKDVLSRRLSPDTGARLFDAWLNSFRARLRFAANLPLLSRAYSRSLALGVTLFDALYQALAEEVEAELVVADDRLLRSPAAALSYVRSLASSRPSFPGSAG